jgi:hypothetical protein
MSYDDERARAQARFLRGLDARSEILLYLAPDYPRSAYKAYARKTPRSPWWRFDVGPYGHPYTSQLPRPRGVRVVNVSLGDLASWHYDMSRPALRALFERAEGR